MGVADDLTRVSVQMGEARGKEVMQRHRVAVKLCVMVGLHGRVDRLCVCVCFFFFVSLQ